MIALAREFDAAAVDSEMVVDADGGTATDDDEADGDDDNADEDNDEATMLNAEDAGGGAITAAAAVRFVSDIDAVGG